MIDHVRLVYAALGERLPADPDGLSVRDLHATAPGIRLAIDSAARHHLLVESPRAPAFDTGLAAVSASHHKLAIGDSVLRHLDIVCVVREFEDVFDHFVAAVAEHAGEARHDLGNVAAEVLDQWRSFFAEIGAPPGRGTVMGVIAELLVLKDIAAVGGGAALATWVGPRGGRHDFRRGRVAVEVKATLAHASRVVTIHGEDQLDVPESGLLYLHFARLEEVAGGAISLLDLVDELIGLGVPRLTMVESLREAGIPAAALDDHGSMRFEVRERATFSVGEDMPRIVSATFVDGERPAGIVDLSYRLDLDHVAGTAVSAQDYQAVINSLATTGETG